MIPDGKITPSPLTRMMGTRFESGSSGGEHPKTSVQRISTKGDGTEPKKTVTGSVFEKFSPYTVNILLA
jgi:hypothetical protein